MLETLNIYAHGYVAVPVILASKKRGLFNLLSTEKPIAFSELVNSLHANSGHLRVALRLMESLDWLARLDEDSYVLTPKASEYQQIPEEVLGLMDFPFDEFLKQELEGYSLKQWFDQSILHWGIENPIIADFVDGLLIAPLLLALNNGKYLENTSETLFLERLRPALRSEIAELFNAKGWAVTNQDTWSLNTVGQFMVDKVWNIATVISYRPMLSQIEEVIFGNCRQVFTTDEFNHELHVDRTMNVVGSGFQHKKFFADMQKNLIAIFNTDDFESQPKYVADMGCGDGSLLKSIYDVITTKTRRGQVLEQYPIKLIGADFNEKALIETSRTLEGTNYLTIKADIGDPAQLIVDLKAQGISDPENILHVRTFLDHDRPYIAPVKKISNLMVNPLQKDSAYVDKFGVEIPSIDVYQSMVEHFERWSTIIGKHGLLVLEVHYLKVKTAHRYIGSESLHFDAYHAFSKQMLVSAEACLMAAAAAGLFPRDDGSRKYPKALPFARITLNYFEKRDYRIRNAQLNDLPALLILEESCWPVELRTNADVIRDRLIKYPEGQLVLELNDEVVGAAFSQKILRKEVITGMSIENIDTCHHPEGAIVQLLGVNISPQVQDMNLGDQLLEFALKRSAVIDDINAVVGVTRCRNYRDHSHLSFDQYIRLKNAQGWLVDPILRFHQLHGAEITSVVANFRPTDLANDGNGAMVEYDLQRRKRPQGFSELQKATNFVGEHKSVINKVSELNAKVISNKVVQAVTVLLGDERAIEIHLDQPLMEMGFDSADLLELTQQLSQEFGLILAPTFFFEYSTCEKVISYIQAHTNLPDNISFAEKTESRNITAHKRVIAKGSALGAKVIKDKVIQAVSILLADDLGIEIQQDQPLMEMGFDSADLLELTQQLNLEFGLTLPPTFFFEYSTCEKVIAYIQMHADVADAVSVSEKKQPQEIIDTISKRQPGIAKTASWNSKIISDKVIQAVAVLLGDEQVIEIQHNQPLMEMGFDSADLLELTQQLSLEFGLTLPPTFFFEYNTCEKVIGYIQAHTNLPDIRSFVDKTEKAISIIPQI